MNKTLKVYYAKVPNMGDILNCNVIKECFGYDVVRRTYLTGEISGIGSGLGNYTYEGGAIKKTLKYLSGILYPTVSIWGTGFISYKEKDDKFYKRNTHICAVRGELSKKRIEKIIGHTIDVPTGDAGILASYLLKKEVKKRYSVGIIAHYKEQSEPVFQEMLNKYENSVYVDVTKTPEEVVNMIAQCETVISSSLHGLIIADSLRVPNIHLKVTDNLLGDGFKFDDYYSAYGLKHEYIEAAQVDKLTLKYIAEHYPITDGMVENKKKEMLEAFPYKPGR